MSDCKITAVCNQKGGVTKTTTTANLGVGLAMQGKKVLLVDIDPQADLTTALGWLDSDALPMTLADVMEKTVSDEDFEYYGAILRHDEGIDLIPSSIELSGVEMSLVNAMSREFTLKNYLGMIKHEYDHIIIDCPPSLSMLTINTLAAAPASLCLYRRSTTGKRHDTTHADNRKSEKADQPRLKGGRYSADACGYADKPCAGYGGRPA
jgi:chromosome partitioning protein